MCYLLSSFMLQVVFEATMKGETNNSIAIDNIVVDNGTYCWVFLLFVLFCLFVFFWGGVFSVFVCFWFSYNGGLLLFSENIKCT